MHGGSPARSLNGYWPPFAQLDGRADRRVTIVRGLGATVWDIEGRSYLDASASLWYANVGHGRTEIAEAVADQMARLAAYSNFGDFATAPTEELTARVASLAPLDDPLVFLTSGGSDAVDSAVKIVRRYWDLQGQPHKTTVISRDRAYHGMHGFGTALAGISANAEGYGSAVPEGFVRTSSDDPADLQARIEAVGPEHVGAVFVEPVIGAGGVVPPAPGYLDSVRRLCDEHDLLLVADEVVTGFGRLGTWFGSDRFGLRPDLLLVAKGITSGYLPLGGVIASRRVWEPFHASGVFRHGYTYSGHATACVAANRNLAIIEDEDLLARVQRLEPLLGTTIGGLADHDLVAEVRHTGLLAAVQLASVDPALVDRVVAEARNNGILTRGLAGGALQVSPPFVITDEEIATVAAAMRSALDVTASQMV